ncbi:uncharacterized protein PRCAT00000053001 [Priceomyces carsonii]|uniref:uncharacterized protein n=1 Tax=Priceomyces carsonii TaxID=28549 RepID=UPI002ED922D2|nr:unnamed protein product [Priceomyces carsonii]
MLRGNHIRTFRPKYGKSSGFLPLPASVNRMNGYRKHLVPYILVCMILIFYFLNPIGYYKQWTSTATHNYPASHPLTSPYVIESSSKYLFPPIEHAPLLKQLTPKKLVKENRIRDANFPEIEKSFIQSLNIEDDPDPIRQRIKEDEENALSDIARVKNTFKNQDKLVYKPKSTKNYPDVVIVTAVDFEKYSLEGLTKIVQNRVDYGHAQNYGVYVRWYQEFLPILHSFSYLHVKEKAKWVRLYCLRAAMFAFPEAKWFWYIEQDALIMNLQIDLEQYLLSPEALDPAMKREQPIIPPDGAIKTYKNLQPGSVKLIVTQNELMIDSSSFFIKNDVIGRSIIEFWGDKLYLLYQNFQYGPDSALTHILQWHPFFLSKSTIISARSINSLAYSLDLSEDSKKQDQYHYQKGDFVVQWTDQEDINMCEKILSQYYSILKGN